MYGILYYAIPFGALYWVGQYLPSGLLSVLSASVPIFVLIFNALLQGNKTTKFQVGGVIISMLGILVIFSHALFFSINVNTILYMGIAIVAYIGAAFATAMLKQRIAVVDHISFMSISLIIGGVILALSSFIFETGVRAFSGISLKSLLYLAIFGSVVAVYINTYLTAKWHIAKVSASRFVSPTISLYIGFVFLGEKLSINDYVGTGFIFVGLLLINYKRQIASVSNEADSIRD